MDVMKKAVKCLLPVVILLFAVGFQALGKNAVSYNKEGWEYLKQSENRRAIFSFKNALKLNPHYEMALLGLADAYFEVGVYDEALILYEKVRKLNIKSEKALTGIAFIFIEQGKFTRALEYFEKALEISQENMEAHYGIAYLYYSMDRIVWAKRKIDGILKMAPYHYKTLLLMADIKSEEKRLNEARQYVQKAIDAQSEAAPAFIKMGRIYFQDYLNTGNKDSLSEAVYYLQNALSIHPGSYQANREMGLVSYYEKNYAAAIEHFKRALEINATPSLLYSLADCHDRAGDQDTSLDYFLKAYKAAPADPFLKSRFEQFLVTRDYAMGHPARNMFNKDNYYFAQKAMKLNMPDEVIMYLRRTLLLNPMNREAREVLMKYYAGLDYDRFVIDELKELQRINPDNSVRERLSTAILKRRNRLYHQEGYSAEMPPRDVPRVLVMDFISGGSVSSHPDAGEVIAADMSFVLQQFGRLDPIPMRKRTAVHGLRSDDDHFTDSLDRMDALIKEGTLEPFDFLLFGDYLERGDRLILTVNIMDYRKGIIIDTFTVSDGSRESLQRVCLRAARHVYGVIPFKGRILKLKDEGIVVNLGLFDGMKPGDKLVIYKYADLSNKNRIKDKLIFTIDRADMDVSYAVPQKKDVLLEIDPSDEVFPLERRRARRVE